MKNHYLARVAIATVAGLCVGSALLIAGLNFESYPRVRLLFDIVHWPASWCARIWSNGLHLPPHGEAAFAIVPMVAAVLQWALLGFLIGVLGCFRSGRLARDK